jgi:N-dimethylarginine dimethylaminohydrolase
MTMEMTASHTNTQGRANLQIEHCTEVKGVNTVTSSTAVLMMSRPEYFEVVYSINPWMQPADWQSRATELQAKAQSGWEAMYETFVSLGISVQLVPPAKGLPDMVFTANSAIVLNKKALLANFRFKERRGEEAHYTQCFERLKTNGLVDEFSQFPAGVFQEGAGDCHWDAHRQLFWAGWGPRSSKEAIPCIEDYFGQTVVGLELASDEFYHVDVSLCPLSKGHLLYYPAAFKKDALAAIHERVPEDQLIPIEQEDASTFCANAVELDGKLFMAPCSPKLEGELNDRGYKVIKLPVEAFALSGGSVYCMTLRLDRRSSK